MPRRSGTVRAPRKALFAVSVATACVVVATAAFGIRAVATQQESAPTYDEAVAAASSDGSSAYIAVARFDRKSDRAQLAVSRLRGGSRPRLTALPPAPLAAELEGTRSIGIANVPGGACVQYSVRSDAGQPAPTISCFSTALGSWTTDPRLSGRALPGELVDSFAARGADLFVALTNEQGTSARVLRLGGEAASDLGTAATSRRRGLFVDFNAPASAAESTPTVSVEANLGRNRSARVIRELKDGGWRDATRSLRSIYPAQNGGAVRAARRWVLTESRSLPERGISSFAVRTSSGPGEAWRTLAPGNVAATRGYSQGGAYAGGSRPWIAWSEQGRLARPGVPVRVYAARALLGRSSARGSSSRVTARRLIWSGRIKSFPPVPRVVSVAGRGYVVFERPVGRGGREAIRATVVGLE